MTGETLASQTLLIYVIGGFSSNEHHVIMGGNLDSFEALWELAEFLGQVKPPTASREDIERSGLEVIQPSSLEEYEKTDRIASNCIERCLICLEDYAPEEHIRVLTCKHAFHQPCVDRWLETGRNNCPACRSKVCTRTPAVSHQQRQRLPPQLRDRLKKFELTTLRVSYHSPNSTPFYPSLLIMPIISLCSHCLRIPGHSLLLKPHATLESQKKY
ncbi:hypothetical protein PISMIDRAFT_675581 [Pisolithus microcarpus 441]|uniref:RING-type domain-containing protein n=1 Tax=Pisolithus microcarpus 441 TaxID=765257 RepID=A0A0C9ZWR5_9AGAM|nr:hypothetical protein PISMIDRAFT_675581 [Pisolithus microcarpus 441]